MFSTKRESKRFSSPFAWLGKLIYKPPEIRIVSPESEMLMKLAEKIPCKLENGVPRNYTIAIIDKNILAYRDGCVETIRSVNGLVIDILDEYYEEPMKPFY